jgi:hypothetical protein
METMEQKTERNARVQSRYDALMREGKHGHYETMFRVVREEVEADRQRIIATIHEAWYRSEASHGNRAGAYHDGVLTGLDTAVEIVMNHSLPS